MTDGRTKWSANGNCVYAGGDLGSLVAECSCRAVAEALVQYANGYSALRAKVAAAMGGGTAAPDAAFQIGRELTDGELEDLAKACEDAAKISIKNHCAGDSLHNFEIAESLRRYVGLRKEHAAALAENAKIKVLVTDIICALRDRFESDGGRLATIEAALAKAGFMKGDGR